MEDMLELSPQSDFWSIFGALVPKSQKFGQKSENWTGWGLCQRI